MERVMAGMLPLVLLPIVMLALAPWLPRWAFMWGMAGAIYAGCKWLTYEQARTRGVRTGALRAAGYLFAWPGMDAPAFLRPTDRVAERRRSEWMFAGLNILIGATMIWVVARTA